MRSYLDHASTSPLRRGARAAMEDWMQTAGGDPGRIHAEGMTARYAIEQARETVADFLGARPREVVFTSGATESITAACFGAATRNPDRNHMVFSVVEHSSVREASTREWSPGATVTEVGVDHLGRVDPDEMMASVRADTALVHIQWGNHEVGTLQPVGEIARRCREAGVLVHIDAAQAVGHVPVDFRDIGADLMSVSGHKFGGPAGTGALLIRRGLRLDPLLTGGDQERARRAGMENTLGIVGFAAACSEAAQRLPEEEARSRELASRIRDWARRHEGIDNYGDPLESLPHIVCLGIEGIEPQPVLLGLDRLGVAVHSGSSCSSEALEPSPVLEAMGMDAQRSLRVSTGWNTTDSDLERLLESMTEVLDQMKLLRDS